MGLSITHRLENNINIVTVSGRIDAETASIFEDKLTEVNQQSKYTVLDFKDVSYMNSFGIGILVCAQKTQLKSGGNIKIACLQPSIRKIFQITYLTKVFEIFDTVEDAVKSFAGAEEQKNSTDAIDSRKDV